MVSNTHDQDLVMKKMATNTYRSFQLLSIDNSDTLNCSHTQCSFIYSAGESALTISVGLGFTAENPERCLCLQW